MSFVRYAVATLTLATAVAAHAEPSSHFVLVDYKEAPKPPAALKKAAELHETFLIEWNNPSSKESWAPTQYAASCPDGVIKPGEVNTGYRMSLELHSKTAKALVLSLNYEIVDLLSMSDVKADQGCWLQKPIPALRTARAMVSVPLSGEPASHHLGDGAEFIFRMQK